MSVTSFRLTQRRRALMATTAVVMIAGFGTAARAATPIDTNQPVYLQSQVGTTVLPDFKGGKLRDNQNNVTDNSNYTVENFPTNTIDAFGNTTTFAGAFTGAGPLTITDSVGGGNVIFSGASAIGGVVTIHSGATMQWGAGNSAFLVGGGNAVTDNGSLIMNFGGGGIGGAIPISGTGSVEVQSGALTDSGTSIYTGVTTIDAAGFLNLSGAGSIANSSNVIANGTLDISGTGAGASITTLNGAGDVSLGAQTLTLTNASGTFSGVLADGGLFGGTGGGLKISGGTETLTGDNTYTGATTINPGAALQFGNGGTTGTVAGNIVDNGLVNFVYGGPVTVANTFSGAGSVDVETGTLVVTGAGAIGGTVTIQPGATMQWGAGNSAFLVGAGNSVSDFGSLVMNFGGGGIGGSIPISGFGSVEVQSGALTDSGTSTYTGVTTIDAAGFLNLSGAGSIANSSDVIANGTLDISGTGAGASITTLDGAGDVSLGAQTLTLTNASGTFSGVLADGGLFGGTGGGLKIGGGTETLTGNNTYTGATTINTGATLQFGNGGTTGTVAGNIVDNGLVNFVYGGPVTTANAFSGTGSINIAAGTLVVTNTSFVSGAVTIDNGATMQWGAGGPAFLVGAGNSVADNGLLLMNFGGGGIAGSIPISGSGAVEVQSGSLNDSGASTYTGVTTIDAAGVLALTGAGSIANSSNVLDSGSFDISGSTAGTSIKTLSGAGGVSLGAQTLTLTNASGTFSGVLADGGLFGGTGGGLKIGGGTETLTGNNTYTGATTINTGATLDLGAGGTTGSVAGPIVDNGLVQFNYSGPVTTANAFSGTGSINIVAGTLVVTNTSFVSGAVTIDNGATMQWGAGGPAFLVGAGNSMADNGLLLMDFGGGGIAGSIPISGSGDLEVQSGSLNDSGASTYTGVTTIDAAGVLALTGAGSIANSSNVIDAGTFDISGTAAGASIVTLNGSGGVSLGAKTLTLTNASGTFGGVIADGGLFGGTGGKLTITAGTETLTGVNTYTGLTTIDLGARLDLVGAGAIAQSGDPLVNGTFDISGASGGVSVISLSGSGQVLLGPNTLTLSNAADTFTGVISGGGGLTIGAGTEILTGVNTFSGTTLIDPGATLQLGNGGGVVGLLAGPITDNGLLVFDGGAGSDAIYATGITGSGAMTLESGVLGLTGTNTYAGPTTVDGGATLQLGEGGTTGTVSGLIVDNGLVQFNYSGSVTSPNGFSGSGSVEVVAGAVVFAGSGSAIGGTVKIDSGATLQWGAGNPTFLIGGSGGVIDNGALVLNFGGGGVGGTIPISGSGSFELQSGSLNNAGVSTYTGPTTIDAAGFLLLSGAGSIADSSNVIDNGAFDISGATAGASIVTLNGTGGVSLGAKTLTLSNASGTFSGVLADGGLFGGTGGGLTIAAGTETLTGTNTYTGTTTINTGATLALGNGGATGSVAGPIVDNGLVQFDYSGPVTIPGTFSGGGSAEVVAGTLIATGASAIGGTVSIDPGATMQWGAGNPAFLIGGSGGVVDNGALVLNFGGGGVGGTIPISGSGSFELQSGSLNNAGASTYTGVTTIDAAGVLALTGAGSIANSSNVIDAGTFDISGTAAGASIVTLNGSGGVSLGAKTLTLTNASGTFGGVIADGGLFGGTGGKLTIAAGTETLTGVNTFTGLTTIDLGATLKLAGVGSIAQSGDPLVNGTFDISGASGGVFVISLSGSGQVLLGANTLTLTAAADTFSGGISGAGGLTIGGGSEILTGVNSYTGATTINGGATLQLGNGGGTVGVLGAIADNGLLIFDGGAASNATLATAITGAGAVTLETGTLGLTGTNTYSGVTTVDTGTTLKLGNGGATGTLAGAVVDDGLVQFDYSGSVNTPNTFSGTGSAEVVAGTVVATGSSVIGGAVTIDNGTTLQWGAGAPAFLVGGANAVVDNGALVMNFGGGGVGGAIPISGTGSVTIQAGSFNDSAASTYTGATTINTGGLLVLSGGGSIAASSNVIDNGTFDISGATAGASVTTLNGGGQVGLGGQTLTLTNASGTFSGVIADGGVSGGTGGALTIAAGTETLSGTNTFTGPTTINAGAALNLGAGGSAGSVAGPIIDNGTLSFNLSNALVVSQTISGAGALNQVGAGTTVLNAVNPFSGATTISGGVLEVGDATHATAALGGNVVVNSGGTLSGHGTISGSVTNGGTVAPGGGGIGTLTVGAYTQAAGATLGIEVSPTTASLLNVVGPASLSGKLSLTFDPGAYSPHIYEIVSGHAVTGTFSSVGVVGSPGETAGVMYQPTEVDLVTEATGNAQIFGALSAAAIDGVQNLATLVEDRFGDAGCPDGSTDRSAPECQGFGAWAYAIGSWDDQSASGSVLGYRNDGVGVIGGIDRSIDNGSRAGAAFAYVHNDLSMGAIDARATGPSYYGALYGRLVVRNVWFDGQIFFMHSGWSVDRTIPGVGVGTSSPNADSEGFLLQVSAPIGDTALRPYGRLTYVSSSQSSIVEQGVAPVGFAINSFTRNATVGEIGITYAPTWTATNGTVMRPALDLGVQDDFGTRGQSVSGNLDGLSGSQFQEAGPRLLGVAGVIDGSLKIRVSRCLELYGDVSGRFGAHQTDGIASVGGVIRF